MVSRAAFTIAACICIGVDPAVAQSFVDEPNQKSPWSVGFYIGALSKQAFVTIPTQPWSVRLEPSFLAALNVTYRAYQFRSIPLRIELDAVLAKRFGADDEWEVGLLPMVRWTWFPWNDVLYTNVRLGLLGASFVSDVSPWERRNSETAYGSRYLNFLVPELTVSSGPDADWEAFVRIHHRSGAWGTINGVYGGSNYVSVGYRQSF